MPLYSLVVSIFQCFANKARDAAADRLENGDVGNEAFRKLIKRDLHDIKTKLDNLLKIDLHSSLNYLEEGFIQFFNCIDEVKSDREGEEASNNDESQATCTAITTRINMNHDHLSTWPSIELGDGKIFNPIQDRRKEFAVEPWDKNSINSFREMKKMKTMMFELLDKMTINEHFAPIFTSPSELDMDLLRSDILVAGGDIKSVEIFSWKEKKWLKIASMEKKHWSASSFIYNNNLFVVGGYLCKSMETLNIKEFPLTWKTLPTKLPYECKFHQTVFYKQQILFIGGLIVCNRSDLISEIKITGTTSYVLKELCHMPEPRSHHGAVVVDDKVFIFGGVGKGFEVLSSVLELDPRTFTFKEMPPLPHPLADMATVQWRDQVVLLGGFDGRERLNSVIMYDSKTGKITVLPSMLEKRSCFCAVITGDTIVVMGGLTDKRQLKSVECFEMGSSSSWTYLPSMNETRSGAIAEVLPFGQKYV
ncbi:ring canal kelch homolog [Xenia sp. Carnegie-2017]|uniref:ring canal kelch homolog n=1 Tax=Xenia sp. Carnegie-2017 TaxID=2897299 RepID=UPI001F03B6D8|nr:ring canal kelch homolog [Xenia sp. Carnegie-2017]